MCHEEYLITECILDFDQGQTIDLALELRVIASLVIGNVVGAICGVLDTIALIESNRIEFKGSGNLDGSNTVLITE